MMHGNKFDENDARDACESYVKAIAMQEGETEVKNIVEEAKRHKQRDLEKLAEVGAIAGLIMSDEEDVFMEATSETKKETSENLGFNITNTNFDIVFSPSEDPDIYKPLEIISYIGMTK